MTFVSRHARRAVRAATFLTVLAGVAGVADAAASAPRPPVAIPEPAMLALFGLGLIAVALVSRRR